MLSLALALLLVTPDASWTEVKKGDGLVIYNRARPGSEVKEVLAVGTFDAPPERVHRVLDDLGRYKDFMPYTKESRVLKKDPGTVLTYERINAPLVAERDYTIRVTCTEEAREGAGVHVNHKFSQSNASGPAPIDDVVRVQVLEGHWELEPIDGGKRTRATYWLYTSPGGSVPTWAVNMANEGALPNLYKAIRKVLPQERYAK